MKRPKIEDFKVEFIKGIAEIASARRQYSKAQDLYIDHLEQLLVQRVSGSVYLTENQIAELAQIGSQHLYLGAMEEGRISYGGIIEILKRYEELRKTDR